MLVDQFDRSPGRGYRSQHTRLKTIRSFSKHRTYKHSRRMRVLSLSDWIHTSLLSNQTSHRGVLAPHVPQLDLSNLTQRIVITPILSEVEDAETSHQPLINRCPENVR